MLQSPTPAHQLSYSEEMARYQRRPSYTGQFVPNPTLAALHQLPRKLDHPQLKNISRATIVAIEPAFEGIPLEFIRDRVSQNMKSIIKGLVRIGPDAKIFRDQRGHSVRLHPEDVRPSAKLPTHVLAPHSTGTQKPAPAALMSTSNVVLALHCANLPQFPKSDSSEQGILQIVPFGIPSPCSFPSLHEYFFAARDDKFLSSMLPFPRSFLESVESSEDTIRATLHTPSDISRLAKYLLQQSTSKQPAQLAEYATSVTEMWRNMVALGVVDGEAWEALDLAWEVVLAAVELSGL